MAVSRRILLGVGGLAVVAGGVAFWRLGGADAQNATTSGGAVGVIPSGDPRLAERAIGRADAPVVVAEYFSLTCSHCAAFHRDTMPRVKKELVDTGKLRIVFNDFPLDQVALTAAMVARSLPPANYEPFVGALLASQDRWAFARGVNTTEELAKMAALAGLSRDAFNAAIADQALRMAIINAMDRDSKTYGIESTPSFVFNGPAAKNKREAGARPFDDFARMVNQAAG